MKNAFIYSVRIMILVILLGFLAVNQGNAQTVQNIDTERLTNKHLQDVVYLSNHAGELVAAIKYNKHGKILWIKPLGDFNIVPQYNDLGKLVGIQLHDEQGVLQETIHIGVNNEVTGISVFNYNASGVLTSIDTFNADGVLTQKILHDQDGNPMLSISYDNEGQISGVTTFDNLTAKQIINNESNLIGIELRNPDGVLVSMVHIGANNEVTGMSFYNYNASGVLTSIDTFNADGVLTQTTFYDESGNPERTESYGPNGEITAITYFDADSTSVLTDAPEKISESTSSSPNQHNVQQDTEQSPFLDVVPIRVDKTSLTGKSKQNKTNEPKELQLH